MSDIFSRLLAEGNRQKEQLSPATSTVYPPPALSQPSPAEPPIQRTEVTTVRPTKRHPFEIYEDQLVKLQRLSAQSVLDGHKTGMSEMVRIALDHYIQTHS